MGAQQDDRRARFWTDRPILAALSHCVLFCLLAVPAAFTVADGFQTPSITAAEVMARQGKPDALLVVDVRPDGEYKSGHIAGAVNIPHTKVDKHLDKLRNAGGVVLYCTQGSRTQLAEQTLIEHDLTNVFHLEGGLGAWRQAGYPIHTGWGP